MGRFGIQIINRLYLKLFSLNEYISFVLRFYHYKLLYPNSISWNRSVRLGKRFFLRLDSPHSKLSIGEEFVCRNNCNLLLVGDAQVRIGDRVFFNNSVSINALLKIEIGSRTIIGENVKFYDHDHKYTSNEIFPNDFVKAPIVIEENCWIGSNVIVLKGVTIGKNSLIGAGCIIHKNIPENSLVHLNTDGVLIIKKR